ncbi:zinc-binding dehydrogenase, partial [Staphylococcus aureus]|nr:zinc-binding dehydrogenase [Staphylococcus aureus]
VGQFAIKSAWMFGAGRVIAIDEVPERLALAAADGRTETLDFSKESNGVYEKLNEMTGRFSAHRVDTPIGASPAGHFI